MKLATIPFAVITLLAANAIAEPREPSDEFRHGQIDRMNWDTWIDIQTGHFRNGAEYWASTRNDPNPGSCSEYDNPGASLEWLVGCSEAKKRLSIVDYYRKKYSDYRRGFNTPLQDSSEIFVADDRKTANQRREEETQQENDNLATIVGAGIGIAIIGGVVRYITDSAQNSNINSPQGSSSSLGQSLMAR